MKKNSPSSEMKICGDWREQEQNKYTMCREQTKTNRKETVFIMCAAGAAIRMVHLLIKPNGSNAYRVPYESQFINSTSRITTIIHQNTTKPVLTCKSILHWCAIIILKHPAESRIQLAYAKEMANSKIWAIAFYSKRGGLFSSTIT